MISWACRKCFWGDWGPTLPGSCSGCGGKLDVTGTVKVVQL